MFRPANGSVRIVVIAEGLIVTTHHSFDIQFSEKVVATVVGSLIAFGAATAIFLVRVVGRLLLLIKSV